MANVGWRTCRSTIVNELSGKPKATILIVDDNEAILRALHNCLGKKGYHLLEARDGEEALLVAKDYPSTIHVLVTDLAMEPMNGKELVRLLGPLRPNMQVVMTSGFADEIVTHQGLNPMIPALQKPFLPQRLLKIIEDLLAHLTPDGTVAGHV